ncbi:unnamed protein product [Cuscuta campestris]|uniref:Kinesin-like protein n=1 Tax=Cuscuta campestris TaxID=132261 RepID=A0A484KH07_9ASTE|nr:unnamed protein product [Cuscuta campestris]
MEVQNTDTATTPLSCPRTVTVRRNPRRRVRDTPLTNIPLSLPKPTPDHRDNIPSFPVQEILSIEVEEQPKIEPAISEERLPENLKVYLRIRPRPAVIQNNAGKRAKAGAGTLHAKNVWPKNPREKITSEKKLKSPRKVCLVANDSHSVTLVPPAKLLDSKRMKSEVYEGFSHVFSPEASQREVYEKMVNPLVDDLLHGKSGMLAALGPSGSGKTHTIFGSGKDPGMVTLALRQLFSEENDGRTVSSRIFHLSMFEISSEKGKSEKIIDLSLDGTDLCTQHTSIRGVQEAKVSDIQQAESIIGHGLLRRATAMTNSNSQSSRSQCIINIRCGHEKGDGEVGEHSNGSTLTIVDLAGAEREKKTGNQGARLLESNFINNTSMVFGQCLRSLLEHQKNPKKPLHKHFQNSLLTRYLRDYLEGKKRMALLITARSEEEDYIDTSFLLRQASPYTKIKFDCNEEAVNINCNKRLRQTLPISNQHKRIKMGDIESCKSGGKKKKQDFLLSKEEPAIGGVEENKLEKVNESSSPIVCQTNTKARDREYHVLLGVSKAIWKVLKDYKKKLEVADNEIYSLRAELNELKDRHSSKSIATSMMFPPEDCQSVETLKDDSELSSCQLPSSEQSGNEEICHENDSENEDCTLKHELKDDSKSPLSSQIISSADMLFCTEDHCSVNIGEDHRVKSHEDPKLEDAIVEDSSLECEAREIIVNSCHCADQDNENHKERTDSIRVEPEPTSNSPLSSHSLNQPQHDNEKRHEHTTSPKPEDVGKWNALEAVPKHTCGFPKNAEKPKRRLQPASAILLKDIGSIVDFVDETEKVKGAKGEKKAATHVKKMNISNGSLSLLRLLTNRTR